jgi:hypothetical protein
MSGGEGTTPSDGSEAAPHGDWGKQVHRWSGLETDRFIDRVLFSLKIKAREFNQK